MLLSVKPRCRDCLTIADAGISGPRPRRSSSNPSKGVLAVEDRTDVKKVQKLCETKDTIVVESMASSGCEPEPVFAHIRRLRICQ